ncbi:MAG: DUF2286 domain-containing protein [Candidatus Methanomethylicia archaeon]|uniref:DUF2286 domain-containing protein n=1 Tax=Thermoproteota archaeon TaxID=2056631 RepID=A0A523BEI9_9CREN|nr:DUF2286 domain-containing protein [Candidatus Methanomethylicia archaeon]MCQ5340658.1 DUF2286 domain-containing protein [Candidatus Methanomethylicia archaeon]RZN56150.1 MAG: DUF2286 domain-containing protein [Candidatus Verstraetearchaeota archaeon]TDA39348.1 MAG: DUF2286 domain-containing protein [Candidatus Verstraetearchaeota archaeon]
MSETLVIRAREGKIVEKTKVPGDLKEVIKKKVMECISLWDVEKADFTVIRDPQYPISVELPLTKEQYELYSKYNMSRTSEGTVIFYVPVYIISFDNEYTDENYIDKEVIVIAPALDEKAEEAIIELAIQTTTPETTKEEEEDI